MILVIEDFAPQRHVRKRFLGDAGYTVREASCLEEARQILATESPRLVVCDVGLPDGNGLAFCVEMKRRHPDIPVIIVTESFRGAHVQRDAMAAGADAFLTEPVAREQLVRIVEKLGKFDKPTKRER